MSIAALIRRMSEAGATPEAIAIAVEAIEARDSADASRRAKAAEKKARQRAGKGDKVGTVPGQSGDMSGTNLSPKERSPTPPKEITPIHPEPTGSVLSETISDAKPKRRKVSYSEAFDALWMVYPTDQNMSKKEAFDAWSRLGEDDRTACMASIPAFRAYCEKHPDYRPIHLCRYIVKRRFEGHSGAASTTVGDTFCSTEASTTRLHVLRFRNEHGRDPPDAVQGGKAGVLIPTSWVKQMELRQANG